MNRLIDSCGTPEEAGSIFSELLTYDRWNVFVVKCLFRKYSKIKLVILAEFSAKGGPPLSALRPLRRVIILFWSLFHFFFVFKMNYRLWNGICMIWEINLSVFNTMTKARRWVQYRERGVGGATWTWTWTWYKWYALVSNFPNVSMKSSNIEKKNWFFLKQSRYQFFRIFLKSQKS